MNPNGQAGDPVAFDAQPAFLESEAVRAWLSQFSARHRVVARSLLDGMLLVSRDSFAERLRQLAFDRLRAGLGPVGLYAEREIKLWKGVPNRLFNEPRRKVRRAEGVGPQPVKSTRAYDPQVGSEGLVANLVSELCKEYPASFLDHPGPDAIRRHRMRRFMLLTDFVGSGKRARTYIDAAWRVRSVRSWWSAGANHGLRFEVVSYAATPQGRSYVEAHASRPLLSVVSGCPTLSTVSNERLRMQMREICALYDPINGDPDGTFGYGGVGALIAFAHGVPNNAPRILHQRSSSWAPLFPRRVTSATREHFSGNIDPTTVAARLLRLRQKRLAASKWLRESETHVQEIFLVLAAHVWPPRDLETLSRKSGLPVPEVVRIVAMATKQGLVGSDRKLTEVGRQELARARLALSTPPVHFEERHAYYPTSLRAPRGVSS